MQKSGDLRGKIAAKQKEFDELLAIQNTRYSQYQKELDNPFNYLCKLKIDLGEYGISLAENWTIEANFVYPLPETGEWNTLSQNSLGDRHILIKDGKYIGTEVVSISNCITYFYKARCEI